MFKFMVPVCLSLALVSPSFIYSQDCGCDHGCQICDDGCDYGFVKTRKKLALVEGCIEIKRLRRVCETDECGCSHSRLALVSEPVTFKRLGLVDVPVDPCRPSLLDRMREKMSSLSLRNRFGGDDCCETCDDGCGCADTWDVGQVMDADFGTDGGYLGDMQQGGLQPVPMQDQYYESAPRMTTPRNEMVPRSTQPRDVIPRNITPRSTTPRSNLSPIESPTPGENHSG